jgi:hypothetical protein
MAVESFIGGVLVCHHEAQQLWLPVRLAAASQQPWGTTAAAADLTRLGMGLVLNSFLCNFTPEPHAT